MSETDYDDTAGAVGGAVGAVAGTVVASLTPFTPGNLLAAAVIGAATAYVGHRLVYRFGR
ncbi:hypothetical protein [Halosimplex halophilum]|uniref:hypothetical protein n=1 Tax=Halosimplex halophilum TaxID=2559572 RepID=UPI00107F546A|nr:hypothetical protein [Halosimplex halophilum]